MYTRLFLLYCIAVIHYSSASLAEDRCEPSAWGIDDEIGAINHLTSEQVVRAASLVSKGERHPLGIVIDPDMPSFPPRYAKLQVVQPQQQFGNDTTDLYGWNPSVNDDILQIWLGTGSQIDGLGHMGINNKFYNCNEGADFAPITGLIKLGIETIPPIVSRGVLLDMARYFDVEYLEGGRPITEGDIKSALRNQKIAVQPGDVILLHTGWTDAKLSSEPAQWGATIPGITNAAAKYLATLKPAAVGADTWGLEAVPPIENDRVFYGHVTLLKDNGIFILETMNTGRLARERVSEFMFVLGQPRMKGAVQMIINPVAIW